MIKRKLFYLTICAFGFGLITNLQIANLSTILQFAGFKAHLISYLWLIAPLTGTFQPLLGTLSDNMRSRYGRRKPLFFISTLLGIFSLVCLPYAHSTLFIILLIIFLDTGANGNAQLSRALILDSTENNERTKAFSLSTALAGLGAMCAGVLPWVLINIFNFSSNMDSNSSLPTYIECTFIIGALFYLITSLLTVCMVKEPPVKKNPKKKVNLKNFITIFYNSIKELPKEFWKLSNISFFAWIAVFSVWNYLSLDIAQMVYHMPLSITDNLDKSTSYLAKANVLCSNYFGLLQFSSMMFSLFIPSFNRFLKIQHIFVLGLGLGGVSLVVLAFTSQPFYISILIIFYGIGWATLSTCPYTMFGEMIKEKNLGYNMGIFNIAVVFPQILVGLILGFIYKKVFMYHASWVILMAGCSLLIATFLGFRNYFSIQVDNKFLLDNQSPS
ncbi:sucrose/H+ symporter [Legionella wadsworthii]|uniref:Sucrose/H+ symporter n=1 Tax=Legionella wadsworthii TaxID=28088 RepID=A0A378LPL3_9GAMM|nr:MFS transporter [Legionella wadsworthii]STY28627.1 sucrose/H+ symporter [Legionella wadsworthii]